MILPREEDRVLVRHVHLRHGRGAVRVHLLRQLAGDLHGLNLGAEGTAEHPFDEALDPGFEIAENADCSHSSDPDTRTANRKRRVRCRAHNPTGAGVAHPWPGPAREGRIVRVHSVATQTRIRATTIGPAAGSGPPR